MASFAHEDLEKLKKFIEFVSENPLILNMPQLDFVRKFILQFGGTIPVGEFQMPAGKCPFGGDGKAESKSCPHPPPPAQPEEDVTPEAAAEEESEESEVELDMEEINMKLLEPNVLYLDENPLKVVKNKQAPKKSKIAKKKDICQENKAKQLKKSTGNKVTVKEEFTSTGLEGQSKWNYSGEDPLFTPEIKMETDSEQGATDDEGKLLKNTMHDDYFKCSDNEHDEDDSSADEEYEAKFKPVEEKGEYSDSNEDDDDGEPLIILTRSKGRPCKYALKDNGKKKKPRPEKCHACRQQCRQQFTQEQRRSICALFWSLSEEGRVQYIRNHIRTKIIRLKLKTHKNRGTNHCYYLDDGNAEPPNLIRVCRKYFETTLCLSEYIVKKALEGYELDMELIKAPQKVKETSEEEVIQQYLDQKPKERSGEVTQQYLDPETGNLVTIDPKAKKTKSTYMRATPKKKCALRKPGDPQPEHNPKPINCAQRCIQKCHTRFNEEERKKICEVFWSLDYKRRKDFILARIETRDILSETMPEFRKTNRPPRAYQTRFFLGSGINGENNRVCKHFFMATLSITRKFITNAIDFADKHTGCYTGKDRRGLHFVPNKTAPELKKVVTDHIGSYPTWVPKTRGKNRYLHYSLTIKRMYTEYKEMCLAKKEQSVSMNIYYKLFHEDFSLSFLKHPEPKKIKGFLNLNPNISHYTGNENGGIWLDPKGEQLDLKVHNPADSFMSFHSRSQPTCDAAPEDLPTISSIDSTDTTAAAQMGSTTSFTFNQSLNYAHLIDPTLNSVFICQPQAMRQELNPNLYDINLPQSHIASTSSLFRRL